LTASMILFSGSFMAVVAMLLLLLLLLWEQ
jgi:hypothetical protein